MDFDIKIKPDKYKLCVFYITILHVIFMQKLYEGPEELVEKMKSLSMPDEYCLAGENLDCLDKLYALCCPPLQAV